MSIKEVMAIGCDGMTTAEIQEEKERRVKVVERLNLIGEKIVRAEGDKAKIRKLNREIMKIKFSEAEWLKKAACFLY